MKHTLAVFALLAAAGFAHAQIAPPPAQPTAQPPAAPAQGASLVKQDPTSGLILRLEAAPEEAALDLVGLTPEERAAADKVLAERHAVVDRALSSNIGTLLKSQGLRKDDNNQERMQALVELRKQVGPTLEAYNKEHGTLAAQLQKVLPAPKMEQINRLASDYRRATFMESSATFRTSTEKDEQKRQAQVRGKETMMTWGFEVVRSVDRQQAAKSGQVIELINGLGLSAEQEVKVHGLAAEYLSLGEPTTAQRREFFRTLFVELDDRQKLELLSRLYGVTPPAPAPTPVLAPVAPQPPAGK